MVNFIMIYAHLNVQNRLSYLEIELVQNLPNNNSILLGSHATNSMYFIEVKKYQMTAGKGGYDEGGGGGAGYVDGRYS